MDNIVRPSWSTYECHCPRNFTAFEELTCYRKAAAAASHAQANLDAHIRQITNTREILLEQKLNSVRGVDEQTQRNIIGLENLLEKLERQQERGAKKFEVSYLL